MTATPLVAVLLATAWVSAQNPGPPEIAEEWRLDANERDLTSQAPLGDYTGIPFNDAGRLRSDTTPESIWGTPEYQCRPHSAPHQWRGLGGARILKEQDPVNRDVNVYHVQFMRSLDRPIFMDGRPHPPAYAPHSWTGFSTGEWIGNTLKVTTTHLKDGYLRRGGPQTSDMYTMTEFLTRHDDILTIVTVIDDPIYQDQPYIHSTTYTFDPTFRMNTEQCYGPSVAENGGTDRHFVPHFLPGQNTALTDWITKSGAIAGQARVAVEPQDWIPLAAARGGVKSLYPEYRSTLDGTTAVESRVSALTVPTMRSANDAAKRIADQSPRDGEVHVLPIQGSVYMLVADGTNITVSVGQDGVVVVNAGTAAMSNKVLTVIKQLVTGCGVACGAEHLHGSQLPAHMGLVQPVHECRHQFAGAGETHSLHREHECEPRAHGRQPGARRRGQRPAGGTPGRGRRERGRGTGDRPRERASPDERAGRETGTRAAGGVAHGVLLRRLHEAADTLQRRSGDRLLRASGQYRRRQLRVLPPLGCHRRRRSALDRQLSRDRRGQRRERRWCHRRPEPDSRPGLRRVPVAGRHVDRAESRTA